MQLRMHAKAGNKRQLTWSAGDALFSVLRCLRSSGILLCCLPLSPFFSLFSSLLFPFFSVLLSFSWKLALRLTKMIGAEASALSQWLLLLGIAKQIGHADFGLYSFSLLLLMLSLEMMKMMAMKACCAGGVVALASVFFLAFDHILLIAFSALPLSRFFLSFFSRFFCSLLSFFVFFLCSFLLPSSSLLLGQQRQSIYSLYIALIRKDSMH